MTAPDSTLTRDPVPGDDLPIVPKRHVGRWISAIVVAALLVAGVWAIAAAPAMEWPTIGHYLFDPAILAGVRNTIIMTILAMVIGVVLGTVIAIMRLSVNPVLTTVASLYQWFFRGTPTLVQLIFWFNLSSLFPRLKLSLFGWTIFDADTNAVMTSLLASLLGLGLNFSAYYSEIVRAGILSVDEGQSDAATAYGLSRMQTLARIVLPQAMKVIIPPTGNELIGMLKFTSLASVVSYSELLRTVGDVYNRTYQVIPLLSVAAIWYLFMTSLLSIGQHFLEKRFARGTRRGVPAPSMARRFFFGTRGKAKAA